MDLFGLLDGSDALAVSKEDIERARAEQLLAGNTAPVEDSQVLQAAPPAPSPLFTQISNQMNKQAELGNISDTPMVDKPTGSMSFDDAPTITARRPAQAPKQEQLEPTPVIPQPMSSGLPTDPYGAELNDAAIKEAQKQQALQTLLGNLGQGANRVTEGLLQQKVSDDFYKDFIKQGGQGVTDIETRRKAKDADLARVDKQLDVQDEAKMRDPASDVSKTLRDELKRLYPDMKLPDSVSGKQLRDLGYNVATLINIRERGLDRAAAREAAAAAKKEAGEAKKDSENNKFIERRSDKLATHAKNYAKLRQAKTMIEEAVKDPSGIKDVASLYQVISALDPESVVREGEVALANQAKGIFGNLSTTLSQVSANPRLLNEKVLKDMQGLINKLEGIGRNEYDLRRDLTFKQAESRGIPKERFNELDPYYQEATGKQEEKKTETKPGPGSVVVVKGKRYRVKEDGDSLEEIK